MKKNNVIGVGAANAYAYRMNILSGGGISDADVLSWGMVCKNLEFRKNCFAIAIVMASAALICLWFLGNASEKGLATLAWLVLAASFFVAVFAVFMPPVSKGAEMKRIKQLDRDVFNFQQIFGDQKVLLEGADERRRAIMPVLCSIIRGRQGRFEKDLKRAVDVAVLFYEVAPEALYRDAHDIVRAERASATLPPQPKR